MQESIDLSVNVARTASNFAQEYPVTIRTRSRQQPNEAGTVQARWNVLPFKEDALRLEPRRASGRGSASYTAALQNSGNTPAHYELSGEDDEQSMTYQFRANPVDLAPGQEARVPLTVQTRRHWLGREQRQPFQVHARPAGSSLPLTAQGELVNKALLPMWLLPAALVVVAAGVVLASAFGLLPLFRTILTVSTPTPIITPTVTSQPTPDLTATANAQATATAVATATGVAQANATATAQANITATAQAATATAVASNISGSWSGTDSDGYVDTWMLTQSGTSITGTGTDHNSQYTDSLTISGSIAGNVLTLTVYVVNNNCNQNFTLTLSADEKTISGPFTGCNGSQYSIQLSKQ